MSCVCCKQLPTGYSLEHAAKTAQWRWVSGKRAGWWHFSRDLIIYAAMKDAQRGLRG